MPANGLPIHRIALPGTRALTVLVAFDAGARNERPEENGMAHFLEHLVFKGGEKYPTYKDVNETAERLGGVLNAYTSHDLVAFHITVRAESAPQAIDLLSDFVGRPRLDAEELDRERGVVIQEINRAFDQPSMVAEYLIDRAAFGEHPLGRTVLGPEENLGASRARASSRSASAAGPAARGGAFLAGNLEHLPAEDGAAGAASRASPRCPSPTPYVPAPEFVPKTLVEERDTNQSHLRMIYRPDIAGRRRARARRARRSTRRCSAARWARACSMRSARSAASATRSTRSTTPSPTCRSCSWARGSSSSKCIEAYTRMREIVDELRADGPTEEEVRRARAYAAGRTVLGFENSGAVARYGATQGIVFGEDIDPDASIAALDAVTYDEVREVAAGVAENLAVACVGPHTAEEF